MCSVCVYGVFMYVMCMVPVCTCVCDLCMCVCMYVSSCLSMYLTISHSKVGYGTKRHSQACGVSLTLALGDINTLPVFHPLKIYFFTCLMLSTFY